MRVNVRTAAEERAAEEKRRAKAAPKRRVPVKYEGLACVAVVLFAVAAWMLGGIVAVLGLPVAGLSLAGICTLLLALSVWGQAFPDE